MVYRTNNKPAECPQTTKKKESSEDISRSQCMVCFHTDCFKHGKKNAKFLGKCNHTPPFSRDVKMSTCAHCGKSTKHLG